MKLAIPNKGRMASKIHALLSKAGYAVDNRTHERNLFMSLDNDIEVLFVRSADIPAFIDDGAADVGITGLDLVRESGRKLDVLLDLKLGYCRVVIAAGRETGIRTPDEIRSGSKIATSFPNLTQQYFADRDISIETVSVSGAAEIMPYLGVSDLIVDISDTGTTLKTHGLQEIATIMESTACLVGKSDAASDPTVKALIAAIDSVLQAQEQRYVMANVPTSAMSTVRTVFPGLSGPTVTKILDDDSRVAVHAVVHYQRLSATLIHLKELGADGILVTPIERLVP